MINTARLTLKVVKLGKEVSILLKAKVRKMKNEKITVGSK